MTGKRKILEIGPGPNPMHHLRQGQGVKPFWLDDGDEYTALDLQPTVFDAEVWHDLSTQYRDRVRILVGDRESLPFENNEFDEIVMLGTIPDNLDGLDRVIKREGLLRVGTTISDKKTDDFIPKLEAMGYEIVGTENYDYQPIQKWGPTPYKVLVFQKAE